MADVFELSAGLTLDLSAFETQLSRAESLCARLDSRLQSLRAGASATGLQVVQRLQQADVGEKSGSGFSTSSLSGAMAAAMQGISVQMDGRTVGQLVSSAVDRTLGVRMQEGGFA